MKNKVLLFTIISLMLLIGGEGCEKSEISDCYVGEIFTVTGVYHQMYTSVKITKVPKDYTLPVGVTIGFSIETYGKKLDVGDIIYFDIIMYKENVYDFITTDQFPPSHVGVIKPCND